LNRPDAGNAIIGDTLRTTTKVDALRQNRPRGGRAPTGLAALRITTVDQNDGSVLNFWRCAMLPLRNPGSETGHADDLDAIGTTDTEVTATDLVAGWNLAAFGSFTAGTSRPSCPRVT
jgi:hypothetical protein